METIYEPVYKIDRNRGNKKVKPKKGEAGFVSFVDRGKNMWKTCITCKNKFQKGDMGKHQRKYVCFDCQPKLFNI